MEEQAQCQPRACTVQLCVWGGVGVCWDRGHSHGGAWSDSPCAVPSRSTHWLSWPTACGEGQPPGWASGTSVHCCWSCLCLLSPPCLLGGVTGCSWGHPTPGPCPPRAGGWQCCWHLSAPTSTPGGMALSPESPHPVLWIRPSGSHSRAVEVRQVVADRPPAQVSALRSPSPRSPCLPMGRENAACGPLAHDGGQVGLLWELQPVPWL